MSDEPETRQIDAARERRAEDADLLRRMAAGDESAVATLYDRYASALYSFAWKTTGGERLAGEVVQETFIAAWRYAARFDDSRGSAGSWLFTLARNKAIDLVRRESGARKSVPEELLELEPADDDTDLEAWLRIRRDTVRAALTQLPPAQREALQLAFFGGLTHVEVADALGIPLGTAKTRIRTALLRLRDLLEPALGEEGASA